MKLTQQYLQELFDYNPHEGILRWRVGRSNIVANTRAGCVGTAGYSLVTIDSTLYRAARVIWIYMFGHIPDDFYIDHINGNKLDNRICNLRLATNKQNQENRPAPKNSSSGYRGVGWHKTAGKWMARICHNKTRETIGFFDTAEEAYAAYKIRASELYTHTNRLP